MTTKFDAADHRERGAVARVQGPSLTRAHVSVGIGVSRENVLGGEGLGGEERARIEYLWPPLTQLEEQQLRLAYEALTGRRVWPKMLPLLRVVHRRHGPDTIPLLGDLYREGGVQDLLVRLRDYPPRLNPDSGVAGSTLTSIEAEVQEPAGSLSSELARSKIASISQGPRPPSEPVGHQPSADLDAWCGCPEEDLQPNVLYCARHYRYGYAGKLRLDRRESNPAAARFFAAAAGSSASEASTP
jgi:hypothetical protein